MEEKEPPTTPSDLLNKFVRSAPFQYINLDAVESQEIQLQSEQIIFSTMDRILENEPVIGAIRDLVYANQHYYLYDHISSAIFRIDTLGNIEGPLTHEGRGPGEHVVVGNLMANSSYLFATDRNNGRINRYNWQMDSLDPLMPYMPGLVDLAELNDEIILMANGNSIGFLPPRPEEGLVAISPSDDITDTLKTILPSIIPPGYQPLVYNKPQFSVASNSQIAASYYPLPWIFLFDSDYTHNRTLIIEYSAFEEMDIPPLQIEKPKPGGKVGGTAPFTDYELLNNGDLLLLIKGELIRISYDTNGGYRVTSRYKFRPPAGDKEHMNIVQVISANRKNEFVGRNFKTIFRFTLPHQKFGQ